MQWIIVLFKLLFGTHNSSQLTYLSLSGSAELLATGDEISRDYFCPICTELLTEPFLTDCGHLLCGTCRDQLLTSSKNDCPICRETNALTIARLDKRFQRQVYSLEVRCQHHDEGCGWVGNVRNLQKHLDPDYGECAKMREHSQQIAREFIHYCTHC